MLNEISRAMMTAGLILLALGGVFFGLSRLPGVGRLPGDIMIRRENMVFYFPFATSLLASVILSVLFYFLNRK